MEERHVAKMVFMWIIIISASIVYFSQTDTTKSQFYQFGPNSNLVVLNIAIDTPVKYTFVVFYSIINNVVRNLNNNILRSWITHNIQDNTPEGALRKITLNRMVAYQINTVHNIYNWFDFLIYIHLLLSQIDLFLIEASSDVFIVNIITYFWYLPNKVNGYDGLEFCDSN